MIKELKNIFTPLIFQHKFKLSIILFLFFIAKMANVYLPFLIRSSVNKVVGSDLIQLGNFISSGLIVSCILYFSLIIVDNIGFFVAKTWFYHFAYNIGQTYSDNLFYRLIKAPLRYHENLSLGKVVSKIEKGKIGINWLLVISIFLLLAPILEIIFSIILLLCIKVVWLSVLMILFVITHLSLSYKITKNFIKAKQENNQSEFELSGFALDSLHNIQTIKSFALEDKIHDEYIVKNTEHTQKTVKTKIQQSSNELMYSLLTSIFTFIVFSYSIYLLASGRILSGDVFLYMMLSYSIVSPMKNLSYVYHDLKESLVNIEDSIELYKELPDVVKHKRSAKATQLNNISFNNVTVNIEEKSILKNFTYNLTEHKHVALVGESGSGKSTFIKTILNLIPYDGEIKMNDELISSFSKGNLHRMISMVAQDNEFFNNTIRYNFNLLNKKPLSDDRIWYYLKLVNLDTLFEEREGLDTVIGEKGVNLSGGQKQKLAIARALAKEAPILILDEATSNLDLSQEKSVYENLKNKYKNRTLFCIAHRLAAIVDFDEIIVMDNGEIEAVGTHEELLEKSKVYNHLWNTQFNNL